jgi:hypothetical protein
MIYRKPPIARQHGGCAGSYTGNFMDLYEMLVREREILVGGKGDDPSGEFKKWLSSTEGRRAIAIGLKTEMEHTKDPKIAREIVTDHLKEDRRYYQKLAKAGINEVSMGVGGTGVPAPDFDPGTGIPVKEPIKQQRKKRKTTTDDIKPLRPGNPADGGMVGVNPMIPGRSAFAKAVESLNR